MTPRLRRTLLEVSVLVTLAISGCAARQQTEPTPTTERRQVAPQRSENIRRHYTKHEYQIAMRDGVRLFTAVYAPKDTGENYPILMLRTPYSIRPYGADKYRSRLGPSALMTNEGYIFVYQDVRGCYMSEGVFVNMRPHLSEKSGPHDVDESTDTHDTIEWLLANIPNHNGRVGMWGISYPGFYAAAGMINAHPALKAVSPQAPIADWFFDDFFHHGAFFLPHCFNFFASFGKPRPQPTTERHTRFDHGTPDGYQFFMDLGPLKNANERHLHGEIPFWNEIIAHPNYDEFWQARSIVPHLKDVSPAVMTVGGWFDAEDLYGPLNIYRSIEEKNPGIFNILVMGPWRHGGWARDDGDRLGEIHFDAPTSLFYRAHIERPFFNHFLKGTDPLELPEAYVFETGANRWRAFDSWPPNELEEKQLYFAAGGKLSFEPPTGEGHDAFVSDLNNPVPFTQEITTGMPREYMVADQRFAGRRPDVLVYQTEVLEEDITLGGPITADLWCETTQTAADWVIKIIDVLPNDARMPADSPSGKDVGGYQMMVRSEVIRGRFRNSYEKPEPFTPDEPTPVTFELQDVLHTFGKGHRIMVQVQSTWFPLVDRNPQKYVDNIFQADEEDFTNGTHRIHHSVANPSRLVISVLGS